MFPATRRARRRCGVAHQVRQRRTFVLDGCRRRAHRAGRGWRRLGDARGASGYSSITLQVTPREAEILVFAQQMKGRLFLTLRNKSDVYFENDLPRVDFNQIETELKSLNDYRQKEIRRIRPTP